MRHVIQQWGILGPTSHKHQYWFDVKWLIIQNWDWPFHPWVSEVLFHLWIWSEPLFQIRVTVKNQIRITNSVDPNETAHDEPSHQDIHCLHRYPYRSTGFERVNEKYRLHKAFQDDTSSVSKMVAYNYVCQAVQCRQRYARFLAE